LGDTDEGHHESPYKNIAALADTPKRSWFGYVCMSRRKTLFHCRTRGVVPFVGFNVEIMKKYKTFFLLWAFTLCSLNSAKAQFVTVAYDYALNVFGNYEPLPSEEFLMFTGLVPAEINRVEVLVFTHKGKQNRKPLAKASWQRELSAEASHSTTFKIPLNYPLEAGKKYDVYIRYLSTMDEAQKQKLAESLLIFC